MHTEKSAKLILASQFINFSEEKNNFSPLLKYFYIIFVFCEKHFTHRPPRWHSTSQFIHKSAAKYFRSAHCISKGNKTMKRFWILPLLRNERA